MEAKVIWNVQVWVLAIFIPQRYLKQILINKDYLNKFSIGFIICSNIQKIQLEPLP